MSLHQLAREAAFTLHGFHIARIDEAPTEWVVRQDAEPYAKYLRTHVLQGRGR